MLISAKLHRCLSHQSDYRISLVACDFVMHYMCQETGPIRVFCASQAYKLISRPRGLALIFSNVHFSRAKDLEVRSGGDVDRAALEMLFKHLGYRVFVRHDQTAQVSLENGIRVTNGCL